MLRSENQRERAACDIERFGRHVLAVGRGRDDAVTGTAQGGDGLSRRCMAPDVDPLVGAAHDVGIGLEPAERFHGVHLLHAERLAVANQRGGVLPVKHVLGQDGHVARTHGHRIAEYVMAFRGHEFRKAGNAFGIPCGVPISGICHLRRGFSGSFRSGPTRFRRL